MNKIIAIVKVNGDSRWYALEKKPEIVYRRHGKAIIGFDGVFIKPYYYEAPGKSWAAFGGAKFEIKLEDGEIVQCYGQYWYGFCNDSYELLPKGEEFVQVGIQHKDGLKYCFGFEGYCAVKSKLEAMVAEYKGPLYDYQDYRKVVDLMKRVDAKRAMAVA